MYITAYFDYIENTYQNLSINCKTCCCSASFHSVSPASPKLPAYSNKRYVNEYTIDIDLLLNM